ncbi:MAG: hypothetical protein EXR77_01840 [Myxococcales bacterium]|nr:hypothetical protein [Myxococcales bacterium]
MPINSCWIGRKIRRIDGLEGRGQVIAATNLPNALDPALSWPPRLPKPSRVPLFAQLGGLGGLEPNGGDDRWCKMAIVLPNIQPTKLLGLLSAICAIPDFASQIALGLAYGDCVPKWISLAAVRTGPRAVENLRQLFTLAQAL